ncbi:aminoglycoside phosphotransferase family protein [Streptomyces sp. NPDC004031]
MLRRLPWGDELRAALGVPRRVRRLGSSPRSRVWHAHLPPGTPVVVKHLVAGPGADAGYAREVAALRLAARANPPVAPRLLATDPLRRVLVLEHLKELRPPADWHVPWATALARLHAAPLPGAPAAPGAPPHERGSERPGAAARGGGAGDAGPGVAGGLPAWQGPTSRDVEAFLRLARALGADVLKGAADAMEQLVERLARLGGSALLHGDPCPGNDLHTAAGVRFVDFEQASLGNGLTELAYLRIGFPTCWCVTAPPAATLGAAEAAYRTAWREATGGEPEGDLADACAGWLLRGDALVERARRDGTDHLREVVRRDWTWGTASARGRLAHRLAVVAALGPASPRLRPFADLAAAVHAVLPASWPPPPPLPEDRP